MYRKEELGEKRRKPKQSRENRRRQEAQQGKRGEDAASAPPQSLIPTHPLGRASNQDETCQRSEAREGRR